MQQHFELSCALDVYYSIEKGPVANAALSGTKLFLRRALNAAQDKPKPTALGTPQVLALHSEGEHPITTPGGAHATKAVEHVRKLSPDLGMDPALQTLAGQPAAETLTAPRAGRRWSPAAQRDPLHMSGCLWAGEAGEVTALGARTKVGKSAHKGETAANQHGKRNAVPHPGCDRTAGCSPVDPQGSRATRSLSGMAPVSSPPPACTNILFLTTLTILYSQALCGSLTQAAETSSASLRSTPASQDTLP